MSYKYFLDLKGPNTQLSRQGLASKILNISNAFVWVLSCFKNELELFWT